MRQALSVLGLFAVLSIAAPAFAVVTGTSSRVEYTGNASTKTFYFAFKVFDASHVKVYLDGTLQASGVTITRNANQDSSPGGSVTFSAAPASGSVVRIDRTLPLTQAQVYSPYAAFPAKATENALDRLTQADQQIKRDVEDEASARVADKAAQATRDQAQESRMEGLALGIPGDPSALAVTATGADAARSLAEWARDIDSGCAANGSIVNVKCPPFNAKGDGVSDDSSALQAAINAAQGSPRAIFFPGGTYRVTRALTVTAPIALVAASSPRFGAVSEIKATADIARMFDATTHDITAQGMVFSGNGIASGTILWHLGPTSGDADRDVKFRDCVFQLADTAIQIYGRGLYLDDNAFTTLYAPVKVYWPTPLTGDTLPESLSTTGMRAFWLHHNRFHDCYNAAVINTGPNADNFTGLVMTDNFADASIGLFRGAIRNSVFAGNVFIHQAGIVFEFSNVEGVAITGNVIAGMYDAVTPIGTRHLYDIENVLVATGNVEGLTFTGNAVSYLYKTGVLFSGANANNVVISGNIWNDTLRGNADAGLGGVYQIVHFGGATNATGLVFTNNAVRSGAYARNDVIVGRDAGAGVVSNWTIRGNVFNASHLGEHALDVARESNRDVLIATYTGSGANETIFLATPPKAVIVTCTSGANAGKVIANVAGGTANGVAVNATSIVISNASFIVAGNTYSVLALK